MKVSTKNKIVQVLQDNLAAARTRKAIAQKKLRSCEENIRWNKGMIRQNDQMMSLLQKKAKSFKLHCPILDQCPMITKETVKKLKKERDTLQEIKLEIHRSGSEIRKWNDLINEASPYKK